MHEQLSLVRIGMYTHHICVCERVAHNGLQVEIQAKRYKIQIAAYQLQLQPVTATTIATNVNS